MRTSLCPHPPITLACCPSPSSSQERRVSAKASAASSSRASPAPTASPPCPSAWREEQVRRRRRRSGRRASRRTACPRWLGPLRPPASHHVSPLSPTGAQTVAFVTSVSVSPKKPLCCVFQWSWSAAWTSSCGRAWWRAATGRRWRRTQATGAHMT